MTQLHRLSRCNFVRIILVTKIFSQWRPFDHSIEKNIKIFCVNVFFCVYVIDVWLDLFKIALHFQTFSYATTY